MGFLLLEGVRQKIELLKTVAITWLLRQTVLSVFPAKMNKTLLRPWNW
jgi:hypothetical protein